MLGSDSFLTIFCIIDKDFIAAKNSHNRTPHCINTLNLSALKATRIRQATEAPVDHVSEGEIATVDDTDNRMSELRSVVSYLRKEKGIVDLQLEMAKRENGVLKNKNERLSQMLQETRDTLAEVSLFCATDSV